MGKYNRSCYVDSRKRHSSTSAKNAQKWPKVQKTIFICCRSWYNCIMLTQVGRNVYSAKIHVNVPVA